MTHKMTREGDIRVSSKTLGHISKGLYRSASAALKELVSNAFDAESTEMVITTNPPAFDKITCRDNGAGMTLDDFDQLMSGGIGNSDKRRGTGLTPRLHRPVIGRIGIGLLAIAQLCHQFDVWSHHRASKSAFHGRVTIGDYLRESLDAVSSDGPSTVGRYSCEPVPYEPGSDGTTIVVDDVERGFTRQYRQDEQWPMPPANFPEFVHKCSQETSIVRLGHYWELLWGLAVQCPLPYHPKLVSRRADFVPTARSRLAAYDFRLLVDQLRLWKPVSVPSGNSERRMDERLFRFEIDEEVYGSQLRVSGYLLAKRSAILPAELRGVLIRIRDVGIGSYDPSFLGYGRRAEGPRLAWVTGELYVDEGLAAL